MSTNLTVTHLLPHIDFENTVQSAKRNIIMKNNNEAIDVSPMPVGRVLNKQLENNNNNDKDKKRVMH